MSRVLAIAFAAVLAGCGGAARERELQAQIAELQAQQRLLSAKLKEHGVAVAGATVADDLAGLIAAIDRLEQAKDAGDVDGGQQAVTALQSAQQILQQRGALALAELWNAALTATSRRQPALFEVYGKLGGPAAAPRLGALAADAAQPAALRGLAARVLIEVDPVAAAPLVGRLAAESPVFLDCYLLVHLLAQTRHAAALPVVVEALARSADRSTRCHAATGLGLFPGETSVSALIAAATGDEYPAVRTNAVRALAKVATPERLRELLAPIEAKDTDAAVRAAARDAACGGRR
ncbi:MAG: HEAT repeat domain-containing protein [Planctomycetes bacterium]|nr:HEAT repeat domain-containing protein [Planctomycetota bacterium]